MKTTRIIATTPIGRLMAKHHRHDAVVKYPPITGPMLNPTPATRAKIVQFTANSESETPSARMVRTEILTPAAPTPCNARPRRRTLNVEVGEPVQMAEPTTMVKMAAWRVLCLPNRSESWAQKNRDAAEVKLKAEMIQFN
jgi:hypothetical protein